MSGFCDNHERRISEVGHLVVDVLIVQKVMGSGRTSDVHDCWACPLSENEFCSILRVAATLEAKAESHGGTYTTGQLTITLGKP